MIWLWEETSNTRFVYLICLWEATSTTRFVYLIWLLQELTPGTTDSFAFGLRLLTARAMYVFALLLDWLVFFVSVDWWATAPQS